MRIAVVGAGIAGLACARKLKEEGWEVTVCDESRDYGGRAGTRREGGFRFDHGAQYFTARDPAFQAQVEAWEAGGFAAPWEGRLRVLRQGRAVDCLPKRKRFVGVPGMSAVSRQLAAGLKTLPSAQVTALAGRRGTRMLQLAEGRTEGPFDLAVLAIPGPRAADLATDWPALLEAAGAVEMLPCFTAMVAFPRSLKLDFDAAFVEDSPLGWVARDSSKPERPPQETWVLQATHAWSLEQQDLPAATTGLQLVQALVAATGAMVPSPEFFSSHFWLHAAAPRPLERPFLLDLEAGLAACGDWCAGSRMEQAWLSGRALAEELLACG